MSQNEHLTTSPVSKWIRPGIVVWLTILFSYLILNNTETKDSYIKMLETITMVAYSSYFIGRSTEKIMTSKETKNYTVYSPHKKATSFTSYDFNNVPNSDTNYTGGYLDDNVTEK